MPAIAAASNAASRTIDDDDAAATERDVTDESPVVCSLDDYQVQAKAKLPQALYEYLASGAGKERTLAENLAAYHGWYLQPRVLRPVGNLSTATTVTFPKCGVSMRMSLPLFVSPAGVHALCEPVHGECTTAAACAAVDIPFGLSQHSTRTIEEVAAAAPKACLWYQSYILKDRALTLALIDRAVAAGYQGLFLTVDSVRLGYREADARNGFDALPPPHRLVNYDDRNDGHTEGCASDSSSNCTSSKESTYNGRKHQSWDQNSELLFEQNVSWDDVRRLKHHVPHLPLVIKGIMTAEDAVLAVEAGADGIMVSNHGGRQLDGCLAALDALPEVVAAVRGRGVPVLMDGGVRRGTDVLKALALGAAAVGIGRPVFFALAAGGGPAVHRTLLLLRREFAAAMALTGCRTVSDISPSLVTRGPERAGSGRLDCARAKL